MNRLFHPLEHSIDRLIIITPSYLHIRVIVPIFIIFLGVFNGLSNSDASEHDAVDDEGNSEKGEHNLKAEQPTLLPP